MIGTPLSFRLDLWDDAKRLLRNRFVQVIKKRDLFRLQGLELEQSSIAEFVVHIVKRGETLNSIARAYGASIYAIAASNMDVVDVDLVLEGQRLHIPVKVKESRMNFKETNSYEQGRCQSYLNFQLALKSKQFFSTTCSYFQFQIVRTNGYSLVSVPIIALMIGCLIKAFQQRACNILKPQVLDKCHAPYQSRGTRWKKVLYDIATPEESKEGCNDPSEDDHTAVSLEDMSRAYTELEPDYLKFLSDCGMSKFGYWRGGSQE